MSASSFKTGLCLGQNVLGDTSRPSDEDDIIDLVFLDLCVLQDLFDRFQSFLEQVHIQLFEFRPSKLLAEVLSFVEALDFQSDRHLAREGTLKESVKSALLKQEQHWHSLMYFRQEMSYLGFLNLTL